MSQLTDVGSGKSLFGANLMAKIAYHYREVMEVKDGYNICCTLRGEPYESTKMGVTKELIHSSVMLPENLLFNIVCSLIEANFIKGQRGDSLSLHFRTLEVTQLPDGSAYIYMRAVVSESRNPIIYDQLLDGSFRKIDDTNACTGGSDDKPN